jgi:hypothetical protein
MCGRGAGGQPGHTLKCLVQSRRIDLPLRPRFLELRLGDTNSLRPVKDNDTSQLSKDRIDVG